MVEGTYIFDCEVFAHDWLFVFKEVATGEYTVIWNDNDEVLAFMERNPYLGGFNNKHYDNHILKAVMCGFTPEQVKEINDLIIVHELNGWDIPALREYRVYFDSFDLKDDCQDGVSLKGIEAHLGIPIEETEVDFNVDHVLSESEKAQTTYYCKYDVDATEILFKLRQGYLDNKVAVGRKRGLTDRQAMYMTNAKLTSVYLQAQKPEKPWTDERDYQYPDKLLRQYIPQEVFDFFDKLHDPNIPNYLLFGGYDEQGVKHKGAALDFSIGECKCTIAYGGIHGAIPTYAPKFNKPEGGKIPVRPDYPPIASGGRNLSLTSLAGAMHNTGYTPAQIYAELKFVNMTQCKPPLDDRELQTITESVTRYRR